MKRKKLVTEKLGVELGVNNAIIIMTQEDLANHDLAADYQASQVSLQGPPKRCVLHDMVAPFEMPRNFNENNKASANRGPYINILKDHTEVTLEQTMEWQRFINRHAHTVEHESLQWTLELVEKSMTTELKELIHDDYKQVVDESSRGTITFYKIVTDRMVLSNQEMVDAMGNYLTGFDIRNINGQNVVVAAKKLKAIIRALGPTVFPLIWW